MEKITIDLTRSEYSGIMHDSRKDVITLMKVCNLLIEKYNELVDEIEDLKSRNTNGLG